MNIIRCDECETEYSDDVIKCPNCGRPTTRQSAHISKEETANPQIMSGSKHFTDKIDLFGDNMDIVDFKDDFKISVIAAVIGMLLGCLAFSGAIKEAESFGEVLNFIFVGIFIGSSIALIIRTVARECFEEGIIAGIVGSFIAFVAVILVMLFFMDKVGEGIVLIIYCTVAYGPLSCKIYKYKLLKQDMLNIEADEVKQQKHYYLSCSIILIALIVMMVIIGGTMPEPDLSSTQNVFQNICGGILIGLMVLPFYQLAQGKNQQAICGIVAFIILSVLDNNIEIKFGISAVCLLGILAYYIFRTVLAFKGGSSKSAN